MNKFVATASLALVTVTLSGTVAFSECARAPVSYKTVVANGRIEIGGKPFYPFGNIFVSWGKTVDQMKPQVDVNAANGFNAMTLGCQTAAVCKAMLDHAQTKNIKLFIEGYSTTWIAQFKDHPALLGYFIADDAHTNSTPQQLNDRNAAIYAVDPDHVTVWADYGDSQAQYKDVVGIPAIYSYPVNKNGSMQQVDYYMSLARLVGFKALFAIPQSFNWTDAKAPNNGDRFPTPHEYRNMLYQNIANSVKGILNYDNTSSTQSALWAEMSANAAEIRQLAPIIMGGAFTKMARNNNTVAGYWVYQGATYVVVVGLDASAHTATYTIPGTGTAHALFPGRPSGMTYSGGKLSGSVSGLDAHVYKIN